MMERSGGVTVEKEGIYLNSPEHYAKASLVMSGAFVILRP
jgi:hypothetical protein